VEVGIGGIIGFYQPLPVALAVVGLVLRSGGANRRSALPLYGVALAVGLGVDIFGLYLVQPGLAAVSLLLYAGCGYLIAFHEQWPVAAALALIALAPVTIGLLAWSGVMLVWYPPACVLVALTIYCSHILWRQNHGWRQVHVLAGLAICGAAAATCLVMPAFWKSWSAGPIAGLIPLLGVATLLALESRQEGRHYMAYLAAMTLSLAPLWIARWAGVTNPELYTVVPGFTIAAAAAFAHRDHDLPYHPLSYCRACAAISASLPLGISAALSLFDPEPGFYTALLLIESLLCMLAAVRFENRSLAVSGSFWLALGLLRALVLLAQIAPATIVLTLAVVLLITAASVASTFHVRLAHVWRQWI
jgi:hypothetical protein